jgi:hypothetical protein
MAALKEHVCNDCSRERGEMPRPTSSAPIRDTSYREDNFNKHTKGRPRSPLNGVWNTSDTNTIRQWQDEALIYGGLEIEAGRSTSVLYVLGHPVGTIEAEGRPFDIADSVQIPLSSNSAHSHPFPFNSGRLVDARCKYCGRSVEFSPTMPYREHMIKVATNMAAAQD